jgi:hypothetical protein
VGLIVSFRFILTSALLAAQFTSCSYIKQLFSGEKEQFDPCDPSYNYYDHRGQHYIKDELVRDDGTIDYERILKALDPAHSRCDPLNREKN